MGSTDTNIREQKASESLIGSEEEANKLSPVPMELRDHLSEHCTHYANRRVGLIWVMQQLQAYYGGWLPNRAIYEASEIVGVSAPEVEGVATFFNWLFRQPVGRKIIAVCDSISCYLGDCEGNLEHMEKKLGIKLGETTEDGEYTLLPIVCLGNCDKAPCMLVDGDLHSNLSPESLDKIFDKYCENRVAGGDVKTADDLEKPDTDAAAPKGEQ